MPVYSFLHSKTTAVIQSILRTEHREHDLLFPGASPPQAAATIRSWHAKRWGCSHSVAAQCAVAVRLHLPCCPAFRSCPEILCCPAAWQCPALCRTRQESGVPRATRLLCHASTDGPSPNARPAGSSPSQSPAVASGVSGTPVSQSSTFGQIERMIAGNFDNLQPGLRGDWQEVQGNWVLRPLAGPPKAVVHFLGEHAEQSDQPLDGVAPRWVVCENQGHFGCCSSSCGAALGILAAWLSRLLWAVLHAQSSKFAARACDPRPAATVQVGRLWVQPRS